MNRSVILNGFIIRFLSKRYNDIFINARIKSLLFYIIILLYHFNHFRFILGYAMKILSVRVILNKFTLYIFDKAARFTPEKHEELKRSPNNYINYFNCIN